MILVIDDDESIRMSLSLLLKRAGYEVKAVSDPESALAAVRQMDFELILMDMNFSRSTSGEEGLELLLKTKIFQPETPVILITAWGSIELAVAGMKAGAFDFVTKPWHNLLLLQRIETALKLNDSKQEAEVNEDFDRCGIIGKDPGLEDVLSTVRRVAPTEAPVLILGENGTGKELIANAVHANSRRKSNEFVKVNLGGISRQLFESEMFGHAKGAFTGAVSARKGRFELADKGTVFLDEIGDLDPASQVKLLRVLQDHTFEPLGDSRTRKTDFRLISATNADLTKMVGEKTFREDLFYRINLITLHIPALRERRGDIPALVRHFMEVSSSTNHMERPGISTDAMEYLCRLPYPGNIRQLKNMVERGVITGGSVLQKEDFSTQPGVEAETPAENTSGNLDAMERGAVVNALEKTGGNLTQAARILGVTRQTLYRRMEKYGLK